MKLLSCKVAVGIAAAACLALPVAGTRAEDEETTAAPKAVPVEAGDELPQDRDEAPETSAAAAPAKPAAPEESGSPSPAPTAKPSSEPAAETPQPKEKVALEGATITSTDKNGNTIKIQLTPEQVAALRRQLEKKRQTAAQKAREKQLLDKTPNLDLKKNPTIKERQSIPKRF